MISLSRGPMPESRRGKPLQAHLPARTPSRTKKDDVMSDKEAWRARAEKELRGRPLEDLTWNTPEGITVQPVYTSEDAAGLAHMGAMPGEAPFTRGPRSTMYTGRPWTILQ